jgi:hypothetical protein
MSITRKQVLPLLMEKAPGFEESWRKHLEWWGEKERGDFNDIAEFAQYVVDAYASSKTSELPAVFDTVERILEDGDVSAKELAVIGVLEDIQTIACNRPFGPNAFVKWLGPLSREAWTEIDQLWRAGGGSLAGVLRVEKKSRSKPQ